MASRTNAGLEPASTEFRRELGVVSSTMLVVGSMIGSGIFIVSADIARTVGSPGYLLVVWAIAGALTLSAAVNYGQLARIMPQAGGQYVYLREAYGPLVGFLYGWTMFLVIQTGTIAAVAVGFAKFTALLFPAVGEEVTLLRIGAWRISAAQVTAIASIAMLTYINARGLKEGKTVQNLFTFTKTAALLGIIFLGTWAGRNDAAITANFSRLWEASRVVESAPGIVSEETLSGTMLLAAIGLAMVGALFSSDAWCAITFTAAEVKDPKRTVPLSLVFGTALVTTLYLLCNVAYLCVLPLTGDPDATDVLGRGIQFAASDRVATAAAWAVLGDPAVYLMAGLIMVSTFGCNNGLILAGARVYYAMARDGVFFRIAGTLNRNAVPGTALVMQGVWAGILCLTGTYSDLLDYVIFAVLIFYGLTIGGGLHPQQKEPCLALLPPPLPAPRSSGGIYSRRLSHLSRPPYFQAPLHLAGSTHRTSRNPRLFLVEKSPWPE